ncbi:MAG TPA: SIR2 family protein [Myxococcales bacterium]|nr:SIR2 family protein [Myxococcales bacterium]
MAVKVPASLVRHLRGGRCVLFAGAGLSAQAKLPSWGKLLGDMVQAVGAEDPDEEGSAELKKLFDAGRYLDVADECKERLGAGYAEILSRTLQVGAGPVPEAHRLVMELPFAAWITTNYDKLLEQAHFQVRGGVPKTLTHLDADTFGTLLFDGAPFILKAHGDVDKPESLIFTTRDYREIIHANPAFNAVFSAILLTRAVLFVGYSLNDPDFRLLLDRQLTTFKKFVPERYAVMAGVGEVEREVLRRTAQIKVIPYPAGQHHELVTFLRELQAQVAPPRAAAPMDLLDDEAVEIQKEERSKGADVLMSSPPPPPAEKATSDRKRSRSDLPSPPPRPAQAPAPVGGAARVSAVPLSSPAPVAGPAPGAASTPSTPVRTGETAAAAGTSSHLVLGLTARGGRTVAVLKDGSGEMVATGMGPLSTGSSLVRLVAHAKNADDYRGVGTILADHLHKGLMQTLETLIGAAGSPAVTLELDAELESKPWELLEVGGEHLALRAAVSRAPVGMSAAARGRPTFRRPVRALLIGDPAVDLPGARMEVELLAQIYEDAGTRPTVLLGGDATLDEVIKLLSGATAFDVVHFAGHAWYDAQDVYLTLAGGVHLTDDAIRPAISHRPPCVMMLNSHYTAFIPAGVSAQGPETLKATTAGRIGFIDVAMRAGVGAFVGCFGSPSDEGAANVAVAFHQNLMKGLPAGEALRRSREASRAPFGKQDWTHLLYALSGYGDLKLE